MMPIQMLRAVESSCVQCDASPKRGVHRKYDFQDELGFPSWFLLKSENFSAYLICSSLYSTHVYREGEWHLSGL